MTPQQVGPVTLADVARRAGVAVSTASLVFSGRGPVAAATAERVRRAASELGYAGPDPRAAQLRTGRTRVIGVSYDGTLASAFADPYQVALLGGFSQMLDAEGYGLLLLPDPPGAAASQLAAHSMDAVLFALCGAPERTELDALAARGLPLLGTGSPADPRVVQLTIDERSATAEIVRHLLALGHTRIGHVTMPLAPTAPPGRVTAAEASTCRYADTRDRVLGFLDAGGSPDLVAAARRAGPRQFREGLERVGLGLPPLESGTREQLEQGEARFSGFPHHASARGRRPVTRTSSRPSAVVSRTSR